MESIAKPPDLSPAAELHRQGNQCLQSLEYDQAIALFHKAVEADPSHLPSFRDLGWVLLRAGRVDMAFAAYQRALALAPNHPGVLNSVALCYQSLGDFKQALAYYKKALQGAPNNPEYLYNLVLLSPPAPESSITRKLEALHRSAECTGEARVLVCFALAKIHEHRKNIKRAFFYYQEANQLQYSLRSYDEKKMFAVFDAIESTFTPELMERLKNDELTDNTPIFVLGMPRSGTSLVEQILASHSAVYGAGEIDVMPHVVEKLIPRLTGLRFPDSFKTLDRQSLRLLSEHAASRLRSYCPDESKLRIVSKTTNNFFLIGVIRLLFPRATVIHCTRDPMDNCWSIFRQNFAGPHPYCYDQGALGRYYRRYQQMMRHWHHVLPGFVYDLSYETLVAEPETTIRALIERCGLPWEDQCLSFYRTKRTVSTASFQQVRQQLFTTSLKSWEPVAEELAELRAALDGQAA